MRVSVEVAICCLCPARLLAVAADLQLLQSTCMPLSCWHRGVFGTLLLRLYCCQVLHWRLISLAGHQVRKYTVCTDRWLQQLTWRSANNQAGSFRYQLFLLQPRGAVYAVISEANMDCRQLACNRL